MNVTQTVVIVAGIGSGGGGPVVPANALLDELGAALLDESGLELLEE